MPNFDYSLDGYISMKRTDFDHGFSHVGKGPKGWSRNDEAIKEDISLALMHDRDVDASNIEVRVESGVACLTGSVPSRQMKKAAEACLDPIQGITDVRNELTIEENMP